MSFLRILMLISVLTVIFLVPKANQVNFYSIPQNSELDSKYSLRFYNQKTTDQSVVEFLFPNQDTSCLVANDGDVRNETVSFMDIDIADYYQVFQKDSETCQLSNTLEFSEGVLTMMMADSPMAGYPEFPMIKDEPVFTLEGKTRYQLYEGKITDGKNKQIYTRLYANFELHGQYVFVRTQYHKVINDEVKADVLKMLDRVYEFYDRKTISTPAS